jgi:nucleoid DNA-binding protein
MNQSELIEKVAQATELNHAVAGQAVKAVANAILDALVAGEEVRVSGLGIFKVAEEGCTAKEIHSEEVSGPIRQFSTSFSTDSTRRTSAYR